MLGGPGPLSCLRSLIKLYRSIKSSSVCTLASGQGWDWLAVNSRIHICACNVHRDFRDRRLVQGIIMFQEQLVLVVEAVRDQV